MGSMRNIDWSKYTREQRLEVAAASPDAVRRHDSQAWVSLFADGGVVEDPVGITPFHRASGTESAPVSGNTLEKFFETFIAPNDVMLDVLRDVVVGGLVVRDVNIRIKSSTGLATSVSTYLLYQLTEENGQLKVARLAAHWELRRMVRQVMMRGWPGLKMMTALSWRMMRVQGMRGMLGYTKGFSGIHGRGKDAVDKFVEAANRRDGGLMTSLFDSNNSLIEFPAGGLNVSPDSFAGRVDARLAVSDLISAGFTTSFRFDVTVSGDTYHGIGIFEFNPKNRKITRARCFWDEMGKVPTE